MNFKKFLSIIGYIIFALFTATLWFRSDSFYHFVSITGIMATILFTVGAIKGGLDLINLNRKKSFIGLSSSIGLVIISAIVFSFFTEPTQTVSVVQEDDPREYEKGNRDSVLHNLINNHQEEMPESVFFRIDSVEYNGDFVEVSGSTNIPFSPELIISIKDERDWFTEQHLFSGSRDELMGDNRSTTALVDEGEFSATLVDDIGLYNGIHEVSASFNCHQQNEQFITTFGEGCELFNELDITEGRLMDFTEDGEPFFEFHADRLEIEILNEVDFNVFKENYLSLRRSGS